MSFAATAFTMKLNIGTHPIMKSCAQLPRMCWCPTVSVLLYVYQQVRFTVKWGGGGDIIAWID